MDDVDTIVELSEAHNIISEEIIIERADTNVPTKETEIVTKDEEVHKTISKDTTDARLSRFNSFNYADNKNFAEGLMDIALLSANANQLRFLLTYNHEAPTFYMSLGLVGLSLVLQVSVGLALIYKRRLRKNDRRYARTKEFLISCIFIITVVNVLLAAFTTTEPVNSLNEGLRELKEKFSKNP